MALKHTLIELCDDFVDSGEADTIWRAVPRVIGELRSEFANRLGITPEVREVLVILTAVEPQLAFGTNSLIFDSYFPAHPGLRIRCECCLEHPAAMVSVRKPPDLEGGIASEAVRIINANCMGSCFEANLLTIGDPR